MAVVKGYAIAIVAAAMITALTLHIIGDRRTQDRLEAAEKKVQEQAFALLKNTQAIEQCVAVNAANAAEAERQRTIAAEALNRLAAQSISADSEADRAKRDAENLRASGLDCPAIDSSFRRWLRRDS